MQTVFIQTNNKQMLGARLARFAIERHLSTDSPINVRILNVDEMPVFQKLHNTPYLRKGEERTFDMHDLQSFTLTRFMPPEQMNFTGTAVVIDPDIFATCDVSELFAVDLQKHAIAACSKNDAWDSSVMLLDCTKLTHWHIDDLLLRLKQKKIDYADIISLRNERVMELPRYWNSLDHLDTETKMLHTTNRLTQPWKTGLPIDFTRNRMPKLFGILPRELIQKVLGKYPTKYQPHPDKTIETFFFTLVRDALNAGAITRSFLENEKQQGHARSDILEKIAI